MKSVSLSGSPRASVGKKDAAALRSRGQVPCVIYGGGEQVHFSSDERNFRDIIYTPDAHVVNIEIEGKSYKTVLQEAQFHRISDKLIHADFLQVKDDKPVTVKLPVMTTGQAEGVKSGGKLNIKMRMLRVRGLVSDMPEHIELNVEKLAIGKAISAADIKIKGLTLLHPDNISVVSVDVTRAAAEEETPAATATAAAPAAAAPGAAATPGAPADGKGAAPVPGAKGPAKK
jgi:large subunit ribosomal protein L25